MESRWKSEAQLQQACVVWAKNYEQERFRQRLFAVFNEGKNVTTKLGLGLTVGVSDLLYIDEGGRLWAIEMKLEGTSHNVSHLKKQCQWMLDTVGAERGRFIDTLGDFKKWVMGEDAGTRPDVLLEYLNNVDKKSVVWRKIR